MYSHILERISKRFCIRNNTTLNYVKLMLQDAYNAVKLKYHERFQVVMEAVIQAALECMQRSNLNSELKDFSSELFCQANHFPVVEEKMLTLSQVVPATHNNLAIMTENGFVKLTNELSFLEDFRDSEFDSDNPKLNALAALLRTPADPIITRNSAVLKTKFDVLVTEFNKALAQKCIEAILQNLCPCMDAFIGQMLSLIHI